MHYPRTMNAIQSPVRPRPRCGPEVASKARRLRSDAADAATDSTGSGSLPSSVESANCPAFECQTRPATPPLSASRKYAVIARIVGLGIVALAAALGARRLIAMDRGTWAALREHLDIVPVCLLLCGLFILSKGCALQAAASCWSVSLSLKNAVRMFAESTLVELVSWPGKLWSDAYKYALMGPSPPAARIATLVSARLAALAATSVFTVISVGVLAGQYELSWWRVAACVSLSAWLLRRQLNRRRKQLGSARPRRLKLAAVVFFAALANAADASAMALIAYTLAGVPPFTFAAWYVMIAAVGSLSTLPLGLGVLEVGCCVTLTGCFAVDARLSLLIVLVYRLLGPFITLLAGGVSLLIRCLMSPSRQSAFRPFIGIDSPTVAFGAASSDSRGMPSA